MAYFIAGALTGVLFLLLLAFVFSAVEAHAKRVDFKSYMKNLSKLSITPIFSGIAEDDYIPSYGELVFSKNRGVIVLGDGKNKVKDLEILSYFEGDKLNA